MKSDRRPVRCSLEGFVQSNILLNWQSTAQIHKRTHIMLPNGFNAKEDVIEKSNRPFQWQNQNDIEYDFIIAKTNILCFFQYF